jgi:Ca-activated chloride channel family protein
MTFQWLIPLAILGYVLIQRRRSQYAVRFTNLDLLANVAPKRPSWRRHVPFALYLLALAALAIALARPEIEVSVPVEEATVMMVMDVSRSMNATDVEPNRLDAAKTAGNAFLDVVPKRFRVGVIGFSTSPELLAPPTTDRELSSDAVNSLRVVSGTAMGDAIMAGLRASQQGTEGSKDPGSGPGTISGERAPAAILLLSDGANTTGSVDPIEAAEQAKKAGVKVFTIALGTPTGEVEVPDGIGGSQVINVPPDTETLKEIAKITGGQFFNAPGADELKRVYEDLGSKLGEDKEPREITVAFAGAGLVLMLIGGGLAAVWFNRFP